MKTDDRTRYENKRLTKTHRAILSAHRIKIIDEDMQKKTQVKVKASQFIILGAKRCISTSATLFNEKLKWVDINLDYLYYEKELIEFALQCLYLTNTLVGECIVQRCGKKDLAIVEIRSLTLMKLTETEIHKLDTQYEPVHNMNLLTFGCDLELMLKNKQTNKFISGDQLVKISQIGFDDAISINGGRVFHPVFEVRPKPANSMEKLHESLLVLHSKLEREAFLHHQEIITDANPLDRFFLGGHIHFGNIPFLFHNIRLLDQFLAIPLSKVETKPSFERRDYYGRLGSVRRNKFQGFEYRVLPTWFKQIPKFLPVLNWIEFLLKNADKLPSSEIAEIDLNAYYQNEYKVRSLDEWANDNIVFFMKNDGEMQFLTFVNMLKKLL